MKNSNGESDTVDKNLEQNLTSRKQLSVAGRVLLVCTSILFWIVGNTLPDSEYILKFMSKVVSVLSVLNYVTWTGERGVIGTLDFIAVHASVIFFCLRILGKPPQYLANLFGVLCTFLVWKMKGKAIEQLLVHLIALFNIFIFGLFLKQK